MNIGEIGLLLIFLPFVALSWFGILLYIAEASRTMGPFDLLFQVLKWLFFSIIPGVNVLTVIYIFEGYDSLRTQREQLEEEEKYPQKKVLETAEEIITLYKKIIKNKKEQLEMKTMKINIRLQLMSELDLESRKVKEFEATCQFARENYRDDEVKQILMDNEKPFAYIEGLMNQHRELLMKPNNRIQPIIEKMFGDFNESLKEMREEEIRREKMRQEVIRKKQQKNQRLREKQKERERIAQEQQQLSEEQKIVEEMEMIRETRKMAQSKIVGGDG